MLRRIYNNELLQSYFLGQKSYLIASFPKVGSTFTRFVLANIFKLQKNAETEIDFFTLGKIMPELGKSSFWMDWDNTLSPKWIKTHSEFSRQFKKANGSLYIVRDPRDTMLSYHAYAKAKKALQAPLELKAFIKDEQMGIAALNRHIEGYWSNKSYLFKYEDLMTNPKSCFNGFLNEHLNLGIDEQIISRAVDASLPDKLRKVEEKAGRPTDVNYKSDFKFVRNASIEQWKTQMDVELANQILDLSHPFFKEVNYF